MRRHMTKEDEITMEMSGFEEGIVKIKHSVGRYFFDKKCMVMTFGKGYDWVDYEILATAGEIDW